MCGISLVYGSSDAATMCVAILQRLQHRGHQAAKIIAQNKNSLFEQGSLGRVDQVFNAKDLAKVKGNWAIGHTRYTTSGPTNMNNSQPFEGNTKFGKMIFCHNGQFGTPYDIKKRKEEVKKQGYKLTHTSDSELFLASFVLSGKKTYEEKLIEAFRANHGSASILGMLGDIGFAARKVGNRPLFRGKINGGWVFASEDYMFSNFEITNIEEVPPGVLCIVEKGKLKEIPLWNEKKEQRFCLFELFYFSHPLTSYKNRKIAELRKGFGKQLAKEHPVKADIVVGVPDSGNHAALGYSMESGIQFELSIIRNHYTGRTFIGSEDVRDDKSKQKYDIDVSSVKGKRVVVVDDSLVRSTTAKNLVEKLKKAGVKEIHFLMASPPVKFPNYYGIDMRTKQELIASHKTVEEIRNILDIKDLAYLSLEGAYEVISNLTGNKINHGDFCDACFTGDYWDVDTSHEEDFQDSSCC